MRTLILTLALLTNAAPALANAGACYNIADGDARSYCLAKQSRQASYCYTIQRHDLRAMCFGEVSK